MSRYYPQEFIQELQQKASIVDIVSQYTQVEKMGHSYLARCPFHDDQTPSLQLNPDKNTFYCHACGAGSRNHSEVKSCDILSFLQHVNHMEFPDAVEFLANMTNTPLPVLSPQEQAELNQRKERAALMEKLADVFHYNLKENQEILQYLGNRGMTHLDMDIWKIGFGGDSPHKDFLHLKDRIVFPFFNYNGEVISFTGRVPYSAEYLRMINEKRKEEKKSPIVKYRDMKGFDKSSHLYGMHIAKDYIREAKTAILVEGWTDVISLHRHGAKHAVSTMGVALSQKQIELLKRAGAKRVIIMRDGDPAGVLATERDSKLLAEHKIECFIYPLENGMDPDTLCLSFGYYNESLLAQIYKFMQPVGQYKIAKIYKETQEEILYHYNEINQTQTERLDRIIDVLLTIEDPVELDIYIRQVSELMVVSYDAIKEKLNLKRKKQMVQQQQTLPPAFQPL